MSCKADGHGAPVLSVYCRFHPAGCLLNVLAAIEWKKQIFSVVQELKLNYQNNNIDGWNHNHHILSQRRIVSVKILKLNRKKKQTNKTFLQ